MCFWSSSAEWFLVPSSTGLKAILLSDGLGSLQAAPLNFLQIIYKNPVCTSQETHYVSATKPNRSMLFGERVAVYCENHTEHTNALCGQNAEFRYVKADRTYSDQYISGY
jgi:hypothetical protein